MSTPWNARSTLDRMLADPDWAPAGGTSNRRYGEIRTEFGAQWVAVLRERVAADPRVWIKEFNNGGSIYIGWNDDRTGGYFVAFGLEHRVEYPEEAMRAFCYLVYTREDDQGRTIRRDGGVGESWFTPPYARDVTSQVDVLMVWLGAHRRTLDHLPSGTGEDAG